MIKTTKKHIETSHTQYIFVIIYMPTVRKTNINVIIFRLNRKNNGILVLPLYNHKNQKFFYVEL